MICPFFPFLSLTVSPSHWIWILATKLVPAKLKHNEELLSFVIIYLIKNYHILSLALRPAKVTKEDISNQYKYFFILKWILDTHWKFMSFFGGHPITIFTISYHYVNNDILCHLLGKSLQVLLNMLQTLLEPRILPLTNYFLPGNSVW